MADSTGKTASLELIAAPAVEERILVVRERQVRLDKDLADLYGVETRRLIEQVKRNLDRFPEDFMFQLGKAEAAALRSQIATSEQKGSRRQHQHDEQLGQISKTLRHLIAPPPRPEATGWVQIAGG
jgi:ORF6N domain-containing protein